MADLLACDLTEYSLGFIVWRAVDQCAGHGRVWGGVRGVGKPESTNPEFTVICGGSIQTIPNGVSLFSGGPVGILGGGDPGA